INPCAHNRGCKRRWMAALGSLHQFWCILSGWTSGGCHSSFHSTFKREGSLDRLYSWFYCSNRTPVAYYSPHKLEKTGNQGRDEGNWKLSQLR
ncbi:hypothetical protein SLEP1_g60554, partial [Rubroshorea leprosula]